MAEKLWFLIPEILLLFGAVVVSVMGLARAKRVRDVVPLVTCGFLALAGVLTPWVYSDPDRLTSAAEFLLMPRLGMYVKMLVCLMGVFLAMLSVGMIDRRLEAAVETGKASFDAIRANRGEYHAFFLLSLMGVMLCASATDLIWLFLALELTSLPTYIMVAMSRGSARAQEAAVKYFFLGALAAGIFLYGFALLYGSTGSVDLTEMRQVIEAQRLQAGGGLPFITLVGVILTILGIAFKIAAAPLHFYAPDVYEGAAAPVTAFLAFVPKTAGMIALISILSIVGWGVPLAPDIGLPQPVVVTLWMIAVLTMTLGNVGALLQTSIKRLLAYSSIAHSGYMIIGLIAGPRHGLDAVLFYLLAYGVMNTAAFGAIAGLERQGLEIESMDDLAGLRQRHPLMAVVLALSAGSLIGIPPLLGFFGKFYLFVAGIEAGQIALVVIAGLNSAISAVYYLRLAGLPLLAKPTPKSETIVSGPTMWPRLAGLITALLLLLLPLFAARLMSASAEAVSLERTVGAPDQSPAAAPP